MSELSLRDRKRQNTAQQIHRLAEEMALKQGIAGVKVDDIADAAAISRRTFFNYFATKEDAILGLQSPVLSSEVLEHFMSSRETLLVRTACLIVAINSTALVGDSRSLKGRIAIRRQYPELKSSFDRHIHASEQLIRPVIEQVAESEDIEVILRLAGAILRYTYAADPELSERSVKKSVETFLHTINRIS